MGVRDRNRVSQGCKTDFAIRPFLDFPAKRLISKLIVCQDGRSTEARQLVSQLGEVIPVVCEQSSTQG